MIIIITIGLPQEFAYYKYHEFFKVFFSELNINLISTPINEEINQLGQKYVDEDICSHLSNYLGSIDYLKNITDYILVITIENINSKETICPIIKNLLSISKDNFKDLKILPFTINTKKKKDELTNLLKIGQILKLKHHQIINAYKKASYHLETLITHQKNKPLPVNKTLIAGNFYSITNDIKNLNTITSDIIDYRYTNINNDLININDTFIKEYIKSIDEYLDNIQNIILIKEDNCCINSIIIELIQEKITNKNIIIYNPKKDNLDELIRGLNETTN